MSLDIYLIGEPKESDCECECGHKHKNMERNTLFHTNITHNLGQMAVKAGIYYELWRAPENSYFIAEQWILPLKFAIKRLVDDAEHFKQFNPKNGWGDYENFVSFLENLLEACLQFPSANIETCR